MQSGGLFELTNPIVSFINEMFTKLVPGGEVILVAGISLTIAYFIKSKNNWSKFSFIGMTLIFYWAFRYLGLGGNQ